MKKHSPEDPLDVTNKDRALWAANAVKEFRHQVGSDDDEETILTDLLADLMHWADRNEVPFDVALERARGHYETEKREDPSE